MLTVLGGIAEFERSLIMRTNEGRAKAKAEGIVFGRKQADHASAPRGIEAARRWRDDARHRDDLQRLPHGCEGFQCFDSLTKPFSFAGVCSSRTIGVFAAQSPWSLKPMA